MRSSLFSKSLSISTIVILFFLTLIQSSLAAVLAIDYGTEWTKAALVKPGIPLQIVLTKDSKRKEQSVVAFKKQERLYGVDAFNLGARFPDSTYPGLKTLLGRTEETDVVKRWLEEHPSNQLSPSNRSSLTFKRGDETATVEELVAMQFVNIKSQAEKMANEKIKEVVLTVPTFWTEQERKAIINAAELAGMRVSTVINDGLAVAINYGTTRTFSEEPQYHLIYDMGAGSTTATVVSFSSRSVKEGKSNKTVIDIASHGVGYDRDLGGDLFNSRLVETLIEAFQSSKAGAKAKTDIRKNGRAFARLYKEASRVKQVLSANVDTSASIESLHEDIDFRTKVTRATFEDITSDLVERLTAPVQQALIDANITLDQLDSVILHGGSVRVPFVQKAIEDKVGSSKIAKTVNADEAAVMGAIFRGAQLNNQFRVKDIRSKDYSVYDIDISSNATTGTTKDKSTVLFSRHTKLGYSKTLAFKTSEDVAFKISYSPNANLPSDISRQLLESKISGVPEKIEKLKGSHECHDPTVKVSLKLTEAGIVEVLHSEVQCEIREKKNLADKFKGFFGAGKEKEEKEDQVVFEAPKSSSSASTSSETATPTAVKEGDKVRYDKAPLRVSVNDTSATYLTPDQRMESKKLLSTLDRLDQTRAAREEALNTLESYIYRSRDFLEDAVFQKVSSDEERTSFKDKIAAVSEWLFSSDSAPLEDFRSKLLELSSIEGPISRRKADFLARPGQVESLQQIINSTKELVKTSRDIIASGIPKAKTDEDDLEETSAAPSPSVAPFHIDESLLTNLETVVSEVESWLGDKLVAQEKLKLWEEPVLLISDLEKKGNQIQSALRKMLLEQAKPKTKPKSKTSSSSTTTGGNSASGSSAVESSAPQSSTTTITTSPTGEAPVYTEVDEEGTTSTATTTVTSLIVEEEPEATESILHEEL